MNGWPALVAAFALASATSVLAQTPPSGVVGAYLTDDYSGPEASIKPSYYASREAKPEQITRTRLIELASSCQTPIAVPIVRAKPGEMATLLAWQRCNHGDAGVMSAEFGFKNGQLRSVSAFEFPIIPLNVLAPQRTSN